MARATTKICYSCQRAFRGRIDAKTCSETCRKRLQRAQASAEKDLLAIQRRIEESLAELEHKVAPVAAGEGGFIGEAAQPTPPPIVQPEATVAPAAVSSLDQSPLLAEAEAAVQPTILDNTSAATARNTDNYHFSLGRYRWAVTIFALVIVGLGLLAGLLNTLHHSANTGNIPVSSSLSAGSGNVSSAGTLELNNDTTIAGGKQLIATGPVLLHNASDSTSALSVQNAAGDNLLSVDTQNAAIVAQAPVHFYSGGPYFFNFQAGGLTADRTFTLPDSSGVVCVNSNNCGYASPAQLATLQSQVNSLSSGSSGGKVSSLNGLTKDVNLQGTSSQVAISVAGNTITIAGPQNLGTGSTPQFQSINLAATGTQNGFTICDSSNNCGYSTGLSGSGDANTIALFTGSNTLGDSILSQSGTTVTVTGNLSATGQYQLNGLQISSVNLSDGANLAKLNGTQTFSGANTFSSASNSFTGSFSGDGSGLTAVDAATLQGSNAAFFTNATNISSGTLSNSRLNSDVALTDRNSQTFTGTQQLFKNGTDSTAAFQIQDSTNNAIFTADTSGNQIVLGAAGALYGKIAFKSGSGTGSVTLTLASPGSSNFTLTLPAENGTICTTATVCTGYASASGYVQLQGGTPGTVQTGNFNINGTGLAGALYQNGNQVCDTSGNCVGTGGGGGSIGGGGTAGTLAVFTASGFTIGNSLLAQSGSTVTVTGNLNATGQIQIGGSQIASSNLSDSANLAKLNGTQTFTGANTFSNASNAFTGSFSGDGSALTSLNASNISSGTLDNSHLNSDVALTDRNSQTFTGNQQVFKNTIDSATGFEIQNNAGTSNLFIADTSHTRIAIGQATANYTLDVAGDVNTTTGFRVGGNAGSSVTCSSGNVLQNATVSGGIITGGTCAVNGAGATTTLQQAYDNSSPPATITTSSASKGILFKAGSGDDSTRLFQIQNSAGGSLLNVDSANSTINLGQLTSGALGPWTTSPNTLPNAYFSAASVTANGYAYYLGGRTTVAAETTVYYAKLNADGTTSAWQTAVNSLPQGRMAPAAATANGYVYVIGGGTGGSGYSGTVYYAKLNADGSVGAWNTSVALPQAVGYSPAAVTNNGYLYVMGGDGASIYSTVYYAKLNADGSTGAWQTSANALPGARTAGVSMVTNGYIYYIGGDSTGFINAQSTIYYAKLNADGSVGTWSTNTNALPDGRVFSTLALVNGYVYVIGGENSSSKQSTIYYATVNVDGSIGAWNTNVNALPQAVQQATSVTLNGYVYTMGGQGSVALNTVSYASVQGMTRNAGQSNIADQLTVGNGLVVTGNAVIQPIADSNSAFSIQNATGGSLFNIDSTNSAIALDGNDSGQLGQWTTNANVLPQSLISAASVTANGYAYVIGGNNITNCTNACSTVYYAKLNADGSTGTWTTNTNALPAVRSYAVSITANGYIYAIGGTSSNAVVSTVYYAKLNADGSTGVWQTSSNALPQPVTRASGVTYNGYVYIEGGQDSSNNDLSTVYYAKLNADGSVGTWSTNTSALTAARHGSDSVVANGYIYNIAGTPSGAAVYYAKLNADGSTGAWQTSTNALPDSRFFATSTVSNGYVYVIGGLGIVGCTSSICPTVYYAKLNADGSVGTWQTNVNALPGPREEAVTFMANGYVYVIGGSTSGSVSTAQTTVYYASTARVSVGANLDLIGPQNGDGTAGGNLAANNVTAAGNLTVQGQGTFNQGLATSGNLNVGGLAMFQSTANTNAFQVQNSTGSQVINLNTATTSNLIANGDFESTINGWSGKGSATIARSDSSTIGSTSGVGSLAITTTAAANDGASYSYTLAASTQYTLSLYVRSGSGTASTINIGRQEVSGTDIDCLTAQKITTTWTRYVCTFTTGSTITPPTSIYIKQTDTTARTFYIDGVQLEQGASASGFQASQANLQVASATNTITLDGSDSGALGPWSTNANTLPATRFVATSVVANGYVYEIGGSNTSISPQSTVYYAKLNADGSTGTWTTNANSLPTTIMRAASVAYNGYVYVIGGTNGSLLSTVYYAKLNSDGSTGAWQTNTNALPQTLDYESAVTANGYVYVLGGNSGTIQSTVYYAKLNANGSTGAWQTSGSTLTQARYMFSSVVANGYVYAIGGNDGTNDQSTVYYAKLNADGSIGSWSTNANALPQTISRTTAVVNNGYVYLLGGFHVSTTQSTVYYAKLNSDGSTGAWQTNTNALPQTLTWSNAVTSNGFVYQLGGVGASCVNGCSTVYYASTSRVQIGANIDLVGLQGGTLSDPGDTSAGSTGGSITAGNGLFVGALQVQGVTSLAQGVSVGGNLTVNSSALFQNAADSTTAFQIDNTAGVSVLNVDTTTGNVGIGTNSASAKLHVASTTTSSTTLLVQQMASQTGDLFDVTNSGATVNAVKVDGANGTTTLRNFNNSSYAFQVQNTAAATLLNVNTLPPAAANLTNVITNGDFEGDITTGWAAKGSSTIGQISDAWQGAYSLRVITTTAANDGAAYAYTFAPSTTYTLSMYVDSGAGSLSDVNIGRQENGSDIDCLTAQTVTTAWKRYVCTFTTGATISGSNIYIKKTGASAEQIHVDGVQLQVNSSATAFDAGGSLQLNGIINSPVDIQNKADSSAAFQVQNAAGTVLLGVNTAGKLINIDSTAGLTFDGGAANEAIYNSAGELLIGNYAGNVQIQTNLFEVQNTTDNKVNFSMNSTGQALFKNSSDSATAFEIQSASSLTPVFDVDTSNGRIGINNSAPGFNLDVTGTGNISSALGVGGSINASSNVNVTGNISLNSTSQSASYLTKKETAGTGGVTTGDVVIIANDSGNTRVLDTTTARDSRVYGVATATTSAGTSVAVAISGDITVNADTGAINVGDQLVTSTTSGRVTANNNATTGILGIALSSKSSGSNGTVNVALRPVNGQSSPIFRNAADSSNAFQIQNAGGTSLFTADSSGMNITIGGNLIVTGNITVSGFLVTNGSYVTTLPSSGLTNGLEIYYGADPTNGVVWHLRYNSSETTYHWEYLGGSPLLATNASLTLPLAGDYSYGVSTELCASGTTAPSATYTLATTSGSLAGSTAVTQSLSQSTGTNFSTCGGGNMSGRDTGVSASASLSVGATGNSPSGGYAITVTPIRVN